MSHLDMQRFASAALPISHMNSINLDSITANRVSFFMWSDGVESSHRPRELTRGSGSTCDFPRELHALAIRCNLTKGSLSDLLDVFTSFFPLVFRHTYLPLRRISCAQNTHHRNKRCVPNTTHTAWSTRAKIQLHMGYHPMETVPSHSSSCIYSCRYMICQQGVLLPVLPLLWQNINGVLSPPSSPISAETSFLQESGKYTRFFWKEVLRWLHELACRGDSNTSGLSTS